MSFLRYFCLCVYSNVHHILCCAFVFVFACLLFFVCFCLVYHFLPVSLDCSFWIALRYSLTFIVTVIQIIPPHICHLQYVNGFTYAMYWWKFLGINTIELLSAYLHCR